MLPRPRKNLISVRMWYSFANNYVCAFITRTDPKNPDRYVSRQYSRLTESQTAVLTSAASAFTSLGIGFTRPMNCEGTVGFTWNLYDYDPKRHRYSKPNRVLDRCRNEN